MTSFTALLVMAGEVAIGFGEVETTSADKLKLMDVLANQAVTAGIFNHEWFLKRGLKSLALEDIEDIVGRKHDDSQLAHVTYYPGSDAFASEEASAYFQIMKELSEVE